VRCVSLIEDNKLIVRFLCGIVYKAGPNKAAALLCYLHLVVHSEEALQLLLQYSRQLGLPQLFAHLVQWLILLLQQGVFA
jgi:hypothetical protein